ncbi:hypothetical protein ACHHYP_07410 [Achlya hypogyna]|uniref:AN1-type domain-containing protein n=1 Tax=Achlya hypogyna TaxID=1202772 RepID=A0A1V9ZLT5_ACHHY|nr:hypothetical protein ACHHYP_07410 [Achlya hypogyna]
MPLDIGEHCARPGCNQKDFLPFPCDCCGGVFCLEHRTYDGHECPKAGAKDARAITCPLCRATIPLTGDMDENAVWETHARTTCKPEQYQEKKKPKERCAAEGCREVLSASNTVQCTTCRKKNAVPSSNTTAASECCPICQEKRILTAPVVDARQQQWLLALLQLPAPLHLPQLITHAETAHQGQTRGKSDCCTMTLAPLGRLLDLSKVDLMGLVESKPLLAPPFERLSEWTLARVEKLLADYLAKDLDFGLDYHGLSLILDGDKEWSERIIKAFGSQNGLINVLSFITGAALVVSATPEEKAHQATALVCFKAFDFSGTGSISMDETTIMFLCALRGYIVMTGFGAVPEDEAVEACTVELFRSCDKDNYSKITKEDFLTWVNKKLGLDHAKDWTAEKFFGIFGLQQRHAPRDHEDQNSSEDAGTTAAD